MSNIATVVDFNGQKIARDRYGVRQGYLGRDLDASIPTRLDEIKGSPRLYRRGDYLFRAGDPFQSLYVIRAGAIKTYLISEDGDEQIIGFYGPGETIGFDAIVDGRYQCNAAALDTSNVCNVSFEAVSILCERSPKLMRELMKGISGEARRLASMLLLGKKSADQRLALFLLSQSDYQRRQGYSATALALSMTRGDIGKYLGLTIETVSRVLGRFEAQGLVAKDRKQICIRDLKALRRVAAESIDNVPTGPAQRALSV